MNFFIFQLIAQRLSNPQLDPGLQGLSGWEFIQNAIPDFINLGLIIGVIVFFFMFVVGGIAWITAGGDKGELESAKNKITNALIGLFLLLLLFTLLQVLNIIFGINLGGVGIPPGPGGGGPPPTSVGFPTPTSGPLTPPPSQEMTLCNMTGGTWRLFGNSCVDNCSNFNSPAPQCFLAATFGCDCGVSRCWDDSGSSGSGCVPNPVGATNTPATTPFIATPPPAGTITPAPGRIIVLNPNSDRSCNQVCNQDHSLACVGNSISVVNADGEYRLGSGSSCTTQTGNCSTVMRSTGIVDTLGPTCDWTYCFCQ